LGLYGLRSIALVGRNNERDQLWASLRSVQQRQTPTLTVIRGPVGCGKSKLAGWLCERAHEVGGATVLRASFSPSHGRKDGLGRMVADHFNDVGLAPYALVERLKISLERQGVTDDYEWRGLAELIQPGKQEQPVQLSSPQERYQLLERMVVRCSQERPVILWLDDVHWGADAVGFANHLISRELQAPLMLLLTSRDDQSGGHSPGIRGLLKHTASQDMPLGQLEPVHASALVRDLLGLQGELADQVEQRAAGNPLFAVQLVGDWVNEGLLESTERGFRLREGAQVQLPDNLHQVWSGAIRPILAASPFGALVTLELASCLGQSVDKNEWIQVCRVSGAAAPDDVADQLIAAGLMRATEVGWQFVQAMLRESLERTSREKGRWRHHNLSCAAMLEDRCSGNVEAIAGRLGRHLLMAGQTERAVGLLLTGVHRLADASEYREALELLDRRDRALESLGAGERGPRRVEGWLLRARVYLRQGRPHLARAWAEQALQATEHIDSPILHGLALSRVADANRHRGEARQAKRQYLAALTVFREESHWSGVGDCLQGLGRLANQHGRFDRSRELLEEARDAYAAINAPLMLAQCIQDLSKAHRKVGNLALARTLSEEALTRFEALGYSSGLARAQRSLAVLDLFSKDWESSRAHFTKALTLYERTGNPLGQHKCLNGLAEVARGLGNYETAETGYRRALEIAQAIGTSERLIPELNLALTILRQGRIDEAQSHLENIIDNVDNANRTGLLGGTHVCLMATAALKNDLPRFVLHFNLGKDHIAQTGMVDPDVAWPAEMAAESLAKSGQPDWARASWELALVQWSALGCAEDVARIQDRLSELDRAR
ncbi:MAG: tetratricopeptide repeat protein, partial [Rhodobacterales bacterium]|nr:tetratricopeptide repeat protein [Rhodobacterales bacterium]